METNRLTKMKECLLKLDSLYSQEAKLQKQIAILETMLEYLYVEQREEEITKRNKEILGI